MSDRSPLLLFGDILLLSGTPAMVLFVIFYASRSPWRSTLVGRSLMYLSMAMSAILLVSIATAFFGPNYPGRGWVRIALFGAMSVTMWRMFWTLLKVQNDCRDETDSPSQALVCQEDHVLSDKDL